jgi:hypothetical protein
VAQRDEWIPSNSDRLAPKNSKTTGPYQPKGGNDDATSGPLGWGARNEPGRPPSKVRLIPYLRCHPSASLLLLGSGQLCGVCNRALLVCVIWAILALVIII